MSETEKRILELLESMSAEIKEVSKQLRRMRAKEKKRAAPGGAQDKTGGGSPAAE